MAYSGRVDLLAARPISQRAVGTCWVMCRRDKRRAGRAGDPVQPCEIPGTDQSKFNAELVVAVVARAAPIVKPAVVKAVVAALTVSPVIVGMVPVVGAAV